MSKLVPLVSVLMTAYNREKYIAEAIESVLASTFRDFELIIVDDASTDNTVAIARKFESADCRVKVFVNEQNLKQFPNRNKAASLAKGKYLKYFDSDDIMYPNCLEVTISSMLAFPDAAAGCEHKAESEKLPVVYSPKESYINHYFKGNLLLFTGPTDCIFKKSVFKELGGFDESIGILADTLFMLKLGAKYNVVGFQKGLTFYRRHDEQVTIGQLDWVAMLIQRNEINNIILESKDCPLNEIEIKIVKRNLKNILVRNLFKFSLTKELAQARQVYNNTGLKLEDCVLSLLPNKKL